MSANFTTSCCDGSYHGHESCFSHHRYESHILQECGAILKATPCRCWEEKLIAFRNRTCLVVDTEDCHLSASDQYEAGPRCLSDPDLLFASGSSNCGANGDLNGTMRLDGDIGGIELKFEELECRSMSDTPFFAGMSFIFLYALCDLFRRTCRITKAYLLACPLRGPSNKGKFTYWATMSFVLGVTIQIVVYQIMVIGGVRIQPDQVSTALQIQAALWSLGLFFRLKSIWRRELIGPCRRLSDSRKSAIRPKRNSVKLKAVLLLFHIVSSHATQVFQTCEQGTMTDRSQDIEGSYYANQPPSSFESPDACDDEATVPSDTEPSTSNYAEYSGAQTGSLEHEREEESSALPEAVSPRDSPPLSQPCEGGCRLRTPDGDTEGQDRSSLCCAAESNIDRDCQGKHIDSRSAFLGNFVFGPRTQDSFGYEEGHDISESRSRAESIVFQELPVPAKVWFAPEHKCASNVRDVVVTKDSFGNIADVVCDVWKDFLSYEQCSFRMVWPQPDEYTYQNVWHFIVFKSTGPTAILLQNHLGVAEDSEQLEFCACALDTRHSFRVFHEARQQNKWQSGRLIQTYTADGKRICGERMGECSDVPGGDNTATPGRIQAAGEGDMGSLMQLEELQVSTIRAMRYAHAVHHGQPIFEPASFATQNFVKKDELRSWIRRVLSYQGDVVVLAVWRVQHDRLVVDECHRVKLDGSNWARDFRHVWRTDETFKTPVVTAVEPQPPVISGLEHIQFHVVAAENRFFQPDSTAHLFDIWMAEDPEQGTGRTFLARRAAVIRRASTVDEIARILDRGSNNAAVPYAVYSQRDGYQRQTFWRYNRLEVPDFSYIDLVFVKEER